jgi:hypothetical protein
LELLNELINVWETKEEEMKMNWICDVMLFNYSSTIRHTFIAINLRWGQEQKKQAGKQERRCKLHPFFVNSNYHLIAKVSSVWWIYFYVYIAVKTERKKGNNFSTGFTSYHIEWNLERASDIHKWIEHFMNEKYFFTVFSFSITETKSDSIFLWKVP